MKLSSNYFKLESEEISEGVSEKGEGDERQKKGGEGEIFAGGKVGQEVTDCSCKV